MPCKKKLVVIVDAYGPARHFRQYLNQLDYLCVHLLSTSQSLPRLKLVDLDKYDATLIHSGNIKETITQINLLTQQLDAELCEIIPGVEPGVLLADRLSHSLNLHSNGIEKSLARRDKSKMADVLLENNIRIPRYLLTDNQDQALQFAQQNPWPIVLKPLNSAGTDGVHICDSEATLVAALNQVLGVENNMGSVNQAVLLQTFLDGKEYMVNTVSRDGKHYVCDIWYAEKTKLQGSAPIYDKNHLISSESREYEQLQDYVFTVLDALDIQFGPAHAEVIITKEGPVLVEIGARISGGVDPEFNHVCLGNDQIQLTLESYLTPERFLQRIGTQYQIKKNGLQIILASKKVGQVKSMDLSEYLQKIPSVINFTLKPNLGDKLVETFDLSSSIGMVHLAADSEAVLLKDYQCIQSLVDEHIKVI